MTVKSLYWSARYWTARFFSVEPPLGNIPKINLTGKVLTKTAISGISSTNIKMEVNMTALKAQNFTMYSGDSKILVITVKSDAGSFLDLTGYTIKWKASFSNPLEKSIGTGITITDAPNGVFQIEIDPADTTEIRGHFRHEVEITSGAGVVSTVVVGTMTVLVDLIA